MYTPPEADLNWARDYLFCYKLGPIIFIYIIHTQNDEYKKNLAW